MRVLSNFLLRPIREGISEMDLSFLRGSRCLMCRQNKDVEVYNVCHVGVHSVIFSVDRLVVQVEVNEYSCTF